jgi:thioredoxin-dependent peroxiredoxin
MTEFKIGSKAPAFTGKDQDGNKVSLTGLTGRKVALYFYPQDNTPTCTEQACNLRDNFRALEKQGITVIGVSPDDEKSHGKFIAKFKLPFPLLADPDKKIIQKYGLWAEKQMYGRKYMGVLRTTILIDEKGRIAGVISKPKVKDHAQEILKGFGL